MRLALTTGVVHRSNISGPASSRCTQREIRRTPPVGRELFCSESGGTWAYVLKTIRSREPSAG
jgi:hypothetical protein